MVCCLFSVCLEAHFCAIYTRTATACSGTSPLQVVVRVYELSTKSHRVVSLLPVRLGPIFIAAPQRGQRLVGWEAGFV